MVAVQVAQEALQIPLMLRRSLMLGPFELGVANVYFAVLAPVPRLEGNR